MHLPVVGLLVESSSSGSSSNLSYCVGSFHCRFSIGGFSNLIFQVVDPQVVSFPVVLSDGNSSGASYRGFFFPLGFVPVAFTSICSINGCSSCKRGYSSDMYMEDVPLCGCLSNGKSSGNRSTLVTLKAGLPGVLDFPMAGVGLFPDFPGIREQ